MRMMTAYVTQNRASVKLGIPCCALAWGEGREIFEGGNPPWQTQRAVGKLIF